MYNIYLHNADKPLGNCAETPQKTTAPGGSTPQQLGQTTGELSTTVKFPSPPK